MHFKNKETWVVLGLVLLALLLRLPFIAYGLPDLLLVDEEFFVNPALRLANGALSPEWFGAPGHTIIYMMGLLFKIVAVVLNAANDTSLAAHQLYALHTAAFQIPGRIIGIVAGSFMVMFVYTIARHYSKRAAILAGLATATSFYLLFHSLHIRPDILQTMLILSMMVSWIHILQHPKQWPAYIMLGLSLGLAVNSKYPTLFLVPGLFLLLPLAEYVSSLQWKKWFSVGFVAVATSFFTSPTLYLQFDKVMRDVSKENREGHGGHDGLNFGEHLDWYFGTVLSWEVGTVLYFIAVGAFVVLLIQAIRSGRRYKPVVGVATTGLAALLYIGIISTLHLHWERWVIPVLPVFFIFGGIGIDMLWENVEKHIPKKMQAASVTLLLIIIFAGPTIRTIRMLDALNNPHTRAMAKTWIFENIPEGTTIVTEPFGPHLRANDPYPFRILPNLTWEPIRKHRQLGEEYLIASETVQGTILRDAQRPETPNYVGYLSAVPLYEKIEKNSDLVFEAKAHTSASQEELWEGHDWNILNAPYTNIHVGAYVRIYKLKPLEEIQAPDAEK